MWDASQAYGKPIPEPDFCRVFTEHVLVNNRYDLAAKNALVAAGGTGFTYPACSAPAYSTSGTYPGGSTVSYQG